MPSSVWKNTELWISHALVFFHCIVNSYPDYPSSKDYENYSRFFNSLKHVLPCKKCRTHYSDWLSKKPVEQYLTSKNRLKVWITHFHNYIHLCLERPKLLKSCQEGDDIILNFAQKKRKFLQDTDFNIWKFSRLWGSHAWVFLHAVCNTYPSKPDYYQKENYLDFFNSLIYTLPCKLCQQHYAQWLQYEPVRDCLGSKKSLKQWIFTLHNHVNHKLSKPLITDVNKGEEKLLHFAVNHQVF